jgi:hypothetical protein
MEQSRAFRFVGPQGNQLSAEAGHKARHMIVGEGLPAADLAMCVDNDEDFVAVARTLPAWPRIESALENLRKTEELHQSMDEAEIRAHQERVIAHVRRGIADLATTMDLHEQHDAVLTRAALGRPPLEPPIFDPLLMYDKPFATSPPVAAPEGTSSLPLPTGTWPVLGWFGWDNRARGVRIFGGAVLNTNPWFLFGRSVWVMGLNGLIPLAPLGFDLSISAAQVF